MTLNARTLGAVLVAAVALSAITACSALAANHEFRSEKADTMVYGERETGTEDTFTVTGGEKPTSVRCTKTVFSGTQNGAEQNTITLHPTFTGCSILIGATKVGVTVTQTGCNYEVGSDTTPSFHLAGEHAALSIECEAGKAITFAGPACTVKVGSKDGKGNTVNQGLHGVTSKNIGAGTTREVTYVATLRTVHSEVSGFGCALAGIQPGTYAEGDYDSVGLLTGYEYLSGPTGSPDVDTYQVGKQVGYWIQ